MSTTGTVDVYADSDSDTEQTNASSVQASPGQADTSTGQASIGQASINAHPNAADITQPNTMPGQEVLPSVESKTEWEMPITIHKQGIKEWYNYTVTMKVSVALVIVLIMMALGVLLWSGIRKIYKKSMKHYNKFND